MNWSRGFSAAYYATIVDPITWRDLETVNIIGGSVKRSDDDLVESADITCSRFSSDEKWIRVWLDARQTGGNWHGPIFTGITSSPERNINGEVEQTAVQCYSVLKPAEDILLARGWYAPAGAKGSDMIRNLLSSIPAPIQVDGVSPQLSRSIIAEDGETILTMVWKILDAMNWRIRILGDGTIVICPKATETSASFDSMEDDVVEPEIKVEYDWYESPNVFRAIDEDLMAIARDDSPDSPLSTVSRGREIWMEEMNCDTNDGESIAEYALRRLKEEQHSSYKVSYNRRFHPDVTVADLVRLHYPGQDITGTFLITAQTIELVAGARMTEEAVKNE